jgi:hypothetical protein
MTFAFVALLLLVILAGVAFAGLIEWLSRSTDQQDTRAPDGGTYGD